MRMDRPQVISRDWNSSEKGAVSLRRFRSDMARKSPGATFAAMCISVGLPVTPHGQIGLGMTAGVAWAKTDPRSQSFDWRVGQHGRTSLWHRVSYAE